MMTSLLEVPMPAERVLTATEFKAKCLRILDQVGTGKLGPIRITKRGRVVAVVTPPDEVAGAAELFGCLRGSVVIPPGANVLGPVLDETVNATCGRVHE
jgi:prevent-host-death family protein